jgi:hypothetical protein
MRGLPWEALFLAAAWPGPTTNWRNVAAGDSVGSGADTADLEEERQMAIWGRLKQELDRASRVAQGAIDEGRVRLEVFRARQRADRAAQTLGYAVYRARKSATELPVDDYDRYSASIGSAEAEIERLEQQLVDLRGQRSPDTAVTTSPPPAP